MLSEEEIKRISASLRSENRQEQHEALASLYNDNNGFSKNTDNLLLVTALFLKKSSPDSEVSFLNHQYYVINVLVRLVSAFDNQTKIKPTVKNQCSAIFLTWLNAHQNKEPALETDIWNQLFFLAHKIRPFSESIEPIYKKTLIALLNHDLPRPMQISAEPINFNSLNTQPGSRNIFIEFYIFTKLLIINKPYFKEKPLDFLSQEQKSHTFQNALKTCNIKCDNNTYSLTTENSLGDGAHGDIFSIDNNSSIIKLYKIKKRVCDSTQVSSGLKEIFLLSRLSHANILSLHQVYMLNLPNYFPFAFSAPRAPYSLDELIKCGEKNNYVWQDNYHWIILKGILSAIDYFHRYFIVHGDLKDANVLISSTGIPQLCDFESCFMKNVETVMGGTIYYADYLSMKKNGGCSSETDMYSFAVIMWSVLNMKSAAILWKKICGIEMDNNQRLTDELMFEHKMKKTSFPMDELSPEEQTMINDCLKEEDRMSAPALLKHSKFSQISETAIPMEKNSEGHLACLVAR